MDRRVRLISLWEMWTKGRLLVLASMAVLASSCTKDGDTVWVDDSVVNDDRDAVVFVYSSEQLGDLTYNDEIYRGVAAAARANDLWLQLELLSDTSHLSLRDQIEILLWTQNMDYDDSRTLIVWCNDNYEPIYKSLDNLLTENPRVTHLVVESNDTTLAVNTMSFCLYGAAYQAGSSVAEAMTDVANVVLVGDDSPDVVQGFRQGLSDASRKVISSTIALSRNGGYNLADSTYRLAYTLDESCQMVVPLCAEVAQGLTRYNREYAGSFYTVGINADMRPYSARVPMSMTKNFASAIQDWIGRWARGEEQEPHQVYGLESGYCSLVISADYQSLLFSVTEQTKDLAIQKEKQYLGR